MSIEHAAFGDGLGGRGQTSGLRAAPSRRARVVVVEDEAVVAMDLEQTLEHAGFEVTAVCDDGEVAYRLITEQRPDLVLMDIMLRGPTDGIEAARRVLQLYDVPVVFLTAYGDDATVARAAEVSPYGYLLKPVDARALRAAVRVALERHEADTRSRWLERAFETAAVSLSVLDLRGSAPKVSYVNEGFARLMRRTAADLVDPIACLAAADAEDPGAIRLWAAALEGRTHTETIECVAGDGARFWAGVGVAPVTDRRGRVTHVTLSHVDVSAQRGFESALGDNERLVLIGRMTAGLVHDLNNVLAVVLSFTSLVREDLALAGSEAGGPTDNVADLDDVILASKRAAVLLRRLLDFSRRGSARASVLELGRVLGEARRLLSQALGPQIAFELHPGPGNLYVSADPIELEQVLLNLVSNARDAMPSGGRLTITATRPQAPSPRFVGGDYARIAVQDTGSGMPPEVIARAFDPLFTTKPKGVGTGLGLHSTRTLVERAGGRIYIESAPALGTTMVIELPISALVPADQQDERESTIPSLPVAGLRCLVVEQDPVVRRALKRMLQDARLEVSTVATGEAALAALDHPETAPDLLICDWMLPGGGARQLLETARERRPELAVLTTSGVPDVGLGGDAPPPDVLLKPFSAPTLLRRVAEALQGCGAPRAPARVLPLPSAERPPRAVEPMASAKDAEVERTPPAGGLIHVCESPVWSARDGLLRARRLLVHPGAREACGLASGGQDGAEPASVLGRAARARLAEHLDRLPDRSEPALLDIELLDLASGALIAADEPLVAQAARVVLLLPESACVEARGRLRSALNPVTGRGYRFGVSNVGAHHAGLLAALELGPTHATLDPMLVRDAAFSRVARDLLGMVLGLLRRYDVVAVAPGVDTRATRDVLVDRGCELVLGQVYGQPTPDV